LEKKNKKKTLKMHNREKMKKTTYDEAKTKKCRKMTPQAIEISQLKSCIISEQ